MWHVTAGLSRSHATTSLSSLQFQYGEDGLSVLKTNLVTPSAYPFLIANHKAAAGQREVEQLLETMDRKKARRWDRKVC